MSRQLIERASLRAALKVGLEAAGWMNLRYEEGFDNDDTITTNLVVIHFLPSGPEPFQIGDTEQKLFQRVVQIDCYMENENRAWGIVDELMDIFDLMVCNVTDPLANNAIIASITCPDTDSIYGEVFAPNLLNPKVIRWRGIVRATLETFYP